MNDRQVVKELIAVERLLNAAGFTVGDFIMQKAKDEESNTYAVVIGEQVGGGDKVVSIQPWRGVAKIDSTKGWYPAPVKINRADVPAKLLAKLEKKIGSMTS